MTLALAEKSVSVGGATLRYREAGAGETIVLLHGADGPAASLLAARHRLLVPVPPGGARDGVRGEAARIAALVRAAASGPVHLVAQSEGAAAACWLAIECPELVKSLVLSAPSSFAAPDANRDLLERLGEIKAPTLLLVGTKDEIVPEAAMRPYQKAIADCHRMFLYGAAHDLAASAGPRWAALVADFIDRGEAFAVNPGTRESNP
jgi:pimeloyl-ACP methyl ester carboxylesterase